MKPYPGLPLAVAVAVAVFACTSCCASKKASDAIPYASRNLQGQVRVATRRLEPRMPPPILRAVPVEIPRVESRPVLVAVPVGEAPARETWETPGPIEPAVYHKNIEPAKPIPAAYSSPPQGLATIRQAALANEEAQRHRDAPAPRRTAYAPREHTAPNQEPKPPQPQPLRTGNPDLDQKLVEARFRLEAIIQAAAAELER